MIDNTRRTTFVQGVTSFAGAAMISLVVPFVVLLVGVPIALAIRGVLELLAWAFGVAVH